MDARELRAFLAEKFDDAELRILAFDMAIPFEDLGGEQAGKLDRIQAMIEWCVRRERIDELSQAATNARTAQAAHPTIAQWPAMTDWGASMQAAQLERLNGGMEKLRDEIAELALKTEGLNQRMAGVERRLDRLDGQQPVGWQTWFVVGAGLVMAAALVAIVFKLGVGG